MRKIFAFATAIILVCGLAGNGEAMTLSALADTLTIDTISADTVSTDTLKKSNPLEAPVRYEAKDSLVWEAGSGMAYLFGEAKVEYLNMQLTAADIRMCLDSSIVHASARADSLGNLKEKAVYTQGSDKYESEKMSFNFKTKKGFISNVNTTQGNGFLTSKESKRGDDGTLYLQNATYTTCDAEHPHFYLKLTKAKVRPGKETAFGPAYLVVEDVPLPLAIPYGFFPFSKKYSSGIVVPTFGDESTRGFYARNGGYYFAINDYLDFKALGEIYTKGSWGLSGELNYRKRYKFNGNIYASYIVTIEGEKNMPDYSKTKSLKVQWSHTQGGGSSSSSSFSARVNFASQNYERKNLESLYNPLSYSQSTRTSSVSWNKSFSRIGLTISASANLSQNMRDSTLSFTLPDLNISLARLYPFRRKHQSGKERWYEKISISYTGQFSNSFSGKEDMLLKSSLAKDWRNGFQHRIPIDASFQLFKYINITPSFSFRDIMYFKKTMRSWDELRQKEVADTCKGFYNLYDWNVALSVNTTLYGFYTPAVKFLKKKLIAVRHVLKPSISVSYAPDFTKESYGYTASYVKTDANGEVSTVTYSPYQGMLYGYPSSGKQGLITMSLSNNLEMKVKSDKDSTGMKKISLIDELGATLSYNMAAQQKKWSDLTMRIRLKLTKSYTFSMNAVFATYAYEYDSNGNVVVGNSTEWSRGRFGRFQGLSQNLSYTFNNEKLIKFWNWLTGNKKRNEKEESKVEVAENDNGEDPNVDPEIRKSQKGGKKSKAQIDDDGYMKFSIPWSLSISYGITMAEDRTKQIRERRMRYPYSFTHTLNFSGFVRIADGWNITFSSGYDFKLHDLSTTTASVSRDLHCFEISASVVLKPYTSYNVQFRARASELADVLKYDKRSSYSSNVQWY